MALLDEILERINGMPPEALQELARLKEKSGRYFVPNPGGQTEAYFSEADELFFGGEPGGGKSALLVGIAVEDHTDSIIFRREFPQVQGLEKEAVRILGSRDGYNAQKHIWRLPPKPGKLTRTMEFGSVPHENDKESYQGRAHDLKGFDEITHFTRSQYRYLTMWTRSADQEQRCRIIATGNPPTQPEGFWVVEHWAPWLDETYHDPAAPGELRWAVPMDDDPNNEKELFFRTREEAIAHAETLTTLPRDENGNVFPPRSRTFIPGTLSENPDYVRTGYGAVLAYASKEYRGLASGKFTATPESDEWQVIPTHWIIDAQKRWTPTPPAGIPMTVIGVDVAQGGTDRTCLAPRHDYWYAPLITSPGAETPNPSDVMALVLRERRANAAIVVDVGGGYGGGVVERLEENNIPSMRFNAAHAGVGRTKDRTLGFVNKRAEAWWRFREALNPDQEYGSPVMLPEDPEVRSDLAAPRYKVTPRGIQIESKEEIKKRIGRSTDKGDAIVMAWAEGTAAIKRGLGGLGASSRANRPAFANVGYSNMKRRRH